ncbi:DUF2779 domain-containing protein [Legionella donaldsonii]|uniref:DUF2779 domain-containing protein n=1 Tax=Legionella donaldsonii TaxID=45060 RepID=UPI00399CF6F9
MDKNIPLLSKTKLLLGIRCLKALYLKIHQPELEAALSEEDQSRLDEGTAVGVKAREYFPRGVLIDSKPWEIIEAIDKTKVYIQAGELVLYEAAFEYNGCYARIDIMRYNSSTDSWDIFEVKSSTKVKKEHYLDIALQAYIIEGSGLLISQANIVHLNTSCYYPNLDNLFCTIDVTKEVRQLLPNLPKQIETIKASVQSLSVPDIDIGPYCLSPQECGFKNFCWNQKKIPDISVFNLPNISKKQWKLYHDGKVSLDSVPTNEMNLLQQRIINCYLTSKRFIDKDLIKEHISKWNFPLIFLDFESINPALPRHKGCHPYFQVPFQFSVHILNSPNAEFSHEEFLHTTKDDPRDELINALLRACTGDGSIVAYYSGFEAQCIEALAMYSIVHCNELRKLIGRLVDPLPIFREAVYDNSFYGSFSLKSVAPSILGLTQSYDGMLVANGQQAQRAYEELISPDTSLERKKLLKEAMLAYCHKDTLVMVELVKWLFSL